MAAGEKFRVLIVDDIAETRENIRKLLQFEGDIDVVGAARTGREAIDLAVETKPDVVLMDINMPDMDGITATEQIRRKVPFSQIIILSVQGDSNYMRRAMLAGARDFLTKPPLIDELSSAVHRAGKMAQEEKLKVVPVMPQPGMSTQPLQGYPSYQGKIIVVYSPKGGTGCTTLATNIALGLHSEETPSAVVDANMQFGDVAVFLNEQVKNSILDLAPRTDDLDTDIVEEVMIKHSATGVRLLAAPTSPEMADQVTPDQFTKILQFLQQMYAYVVVDTSSYLTEIILSAMDIADITVLITTQDIPAIKNSKAFLSLMDGMRIPRQRVLFVLNRFDKRIAISPEKLGESLKQEIVAVVPLDDRIVLNSVNRGIPFMMDSKTQPVGRSVVSLCDQIKARITKLESPELDRVGKR